MRGWQLERPDQVEVPAVLNPASNTVVADIQELPPAVQSLHWVAPQPYLGDRVSQWTKTTLKQHEINMCLLMFKLWCYVSITVTGY